MNNLNENGNIPNPIDSIPSESVAIPNPIGSIPNETAAILNKCITREPDSGCVTLRRQFPFMWKLCLGYGICYLLFAYRNLDGIGGGIFSAVSAAFLLLIARRLKRYPAEEEQLPIHISWGCVVYLCAAVLISFSNCLTDSAFFLFFNHVGSFLLFSIACIKLFYHDTAWDFGKYTAILFGYWFQILEAIPVPFRDCSSYRRRKDKKLSPTARYILIGIAAGLPFLFVTTLLLASADQIFSNLLTSICNFDTLANWMAETLPQNVILLPVGFGFYTLLLYVAAAALCKGGLREEVHTPATFATPIAVTIFSMIDVVYVIFAGIQFIFLFARVPLAANEYAEYARSGFFELLFVALINFFLVLFCNKHFVRNTALKTVMTITCLCTLVMTASSAYRMIQYIRAYHLTFLRVFVLWFLLLLSFFMIGSIVSIYREHWNSFRYCLFVLTCLYTVFALSHPDSIIAEYNVTQFSRAMDTALESGQNSRHLPYLDNYLPSGYASSTSYAAALAELGETYGDRLGRKNCELLDNYFTPENFFFADDFRGHYSLKPDADIYDSGLPSSVFSWKHFNFAEYTCYRRCAEWQTP